MSHYVLHENLVGKHVTLESGRFNSECLIVGVRDGPDGLWILLQHVKTGALFQSRLENLNVVVS